MGIRLKKMRDIQNLKVEGDGVVKGPIADSSNYEYDKVTRMFKKKEGLVSIEKKKFANDTEEKQNSDNEVDEKVEEEKKDKSKEMEDGIMDELVKEIEEL